jgi:predicted ATPase
MIDLVHLENFKCLLDLTVRLGPFTVLIGPNDSGKSSFLDAVYILGRTTQAPLPEVFETRPVRSASSSLEQLVWCADTGRTIGWHVNARTPAEPFEYHLELPAKYNWRTRPSLGHGVPWVERLVFAGTVSFDSGTLKFQKGHGAQVNQATVPLDGTRTILAASAQVGAPGLQAAAHALASTVKYQLDPEALRLPGAPAPSPQLTPSGDNLATVLESILTGPDRSAVVNLERTLHEAIPTLAGITLPTVQQPNPTKALEFTLAGRNGQPVTIPAALASDGALLLTAFLALAYGNTPDILLIEEPENGLHPSRLKLVIDILYKISRGEIGNRPRQVVLTTQSPLLLNFVRAEEVRIFRRNEGGATEVTEMHTLPNISNLLKEFATGELWYLFGEEELLKGAQA